MSLTLTRQWSVTTHAYQFMLKDEIDAKLLEETRGLVAKWEKTGLLDKNAVDKNPNLAILLESHSTLVMDDGTRINYMTEQEKNQKLKEYYERVTKHETQIAT